MADVVQWHSRRVAACVLILLYVNRQRRNTKRWKNRKVWTKPYISRNLTLGAYNTLVQELRAEGAAAFRIFFSNGPNLLRRAFKRPSQGKLKLANSCWQTQVGVCEQRKNSRQTRFYLTPTVCKRVWRLFLCRSHTPTWVCQHEFANLSLPCEGRFRNGEAANTKQDTNMRKGIPAGKILALTLRYLATGEYLLRFVHIRFVMAKRASLGDRIFNQNVMLVVIQRAVYILAAYDKYWTSLTCLK